jgi:diketogulonate reductase-like aldo/keto reductase
VAASIPRIGLPLGDSIPVLGQGTLGMGIDEDRRDDEVSALQVGIDAGMTLIDTGAAYGDGAAEDVVSDAIYGRRDDVFLVGQARSAPASRHQLVVACEQSLRRLGTDYLDLYLVHARGFELLEETLEELALLVDRALIVYWGVSHFGVRDLEALLRAPGPGAAHVQVDQVPYSLARRSIEADVLPWCRERGIPVMACSPLDDGRLLGHPALRHVAEHHRATPAQVALAWLAGRGGVAAIPKAATPAHVEENRAALELRLAGDDLAELERAFPTPAQDRASIARDQEPGTSSR